jgi:hypothetical protein
MFSLDALKAVEKELRMYKEMAEKNLANCDRVQEQVDHLYKKKKEQDKTRNKLIKKQDSYSGSCAVLRVWQGVGSQMQCIQKQEMACPVLHGPPKPLEVYQAPLPAPPRLAFSHHKGALPGSMNASKLASRTSAMLFEMGQ